jgi:hypothetical protein
MRLLNDQYNQSTVGQQVFGVIGANSATRTTRTTSGVDTVEGAGQFTYTVGPGLYRITAYVATSIVSNAGTSDLAEVVVTYTDDVGTKTEVRLDSWEPQHTLEHRSSGGKECWTGLVRVNTGSNVVVALKHTLSGTAKTAGQVKWSAVIERIAP